MQEQIITEENLPNLKKIIKKNRNNSTLKLSFQYKNKIYTTPTKKLPQYNKYLHTIEAFNIKDQHQRISYIYDYLCNYFDEDMKKNNYCEFQKDGTCIANRLGYSIHPDNGCCYIINKGLCKYLTKNGCTNPNPSCKIYMCNYLNKVKKVPNYDTKKIYLTECLFTNKEHNFFKRHYFITKEEYLEKYFQKIKV